MQDETMEGAATPQQVIELFNGRVTAGDLEGALSLYEAGAAFAPEPDRLVHGTDAIREALAAMVGAGPQLSGDIVKVVEAGDLATVFVRWTMSATGPDGAALHQDGTSADVMRRGPDGNWLIAIDDPWGA